MLYGYAGRILTVNLSTERLTADELDENSARDFLGGFGFSLRVLYDEVGPEIDALDPANVIVIASGVLTATGAPTAGRTQITTKSPLTGVVGTGNFGGWWSTRLKRAGFDAIVVRNSCTRPVFLWIHDGVAELRSAAHLWGKDAWETTDALKEELGADISVLSIGQAGENLVRFACPVADYDHAPGRSHAGCVMGEKKLKAIAVRGTDEIHVANPESFREAVKEATERIDGYPEKGLRMRVGSNYHTRDKADLKCAPARNFQTGIISQDSEIWDFPTNMEDHLITDRGRYCYQCPMAKYYGCDLVARLTTGEYAGLEIGGVGFSLPGAEWGQKCGITSFPAMWKCRELCQRYGMDQAGPVPFAMELYEKGIISKADTDGLELEWGNESAVMKLLGRIAHREGIGDVLAEGSARAAAIIGRDAGKYALTTKGMEVLFDPRVTKPARMLGYLVGPRGDDINTTHAIYEAIPAWAKRAGWSRDRYVQWFVDWIDMFDEVKREVFGLPPRADALGDDTIQGKAALTKWHGEITSVFNSLGLCMMGTNNFSAIGPTLFAKLYSGATGWHITAREIMKTGERIFNLLKAYGVREGMTRADDIWPARFCEEPLTEGSAKGTALSMGEVTGLLDEYYELMGWDKQSGLPTRRKLVELDLEEVADELESMGRLAR